jgi:uncharacterized protein (DUF427 family)
MSVRMSAAYASLLGELRVEPIGKRIRAVVDGATIVDTVQAILVWEPRRVVPSYAVPIQDIRAELSTSGRADAGNDDTGLRLSAVTERKVLDPSIPFTVHTAAGEAMTVRAGTRTIDAARFDDAALDGYLVLDFAGADEWYEEDERNYAHPRDPFQRIDVLPSSRLVQLAAHGTVLAETRRAHLLFETLLPPRYYLPRADVRVELRPSPHTTWCAYKGKASYLSAVVGDRMLENLVWFYPDPLPDAHRVRDLVCFFNERVDVTIDGQRQERPVTPWSEPGS